MDIDQKHAKHAEQQAADTQNLHGLRQAKTLSKVLDLSQKDDIGILLKSCMKGPYYGSIGQKAIGIGQ